QSDPLRKGRQVNGSPEIDDPLWGAPTKLATVAKNVATRYLVIITDAVIGLGPVDADDLAEHVFLRARSRLRRIDHQVRRALPGQARREQPQRDPEHAV